MVANDDGNGSETIPDEKNDANAECPKQGQTKLVEGLNKHGFVMEFPINIPLLAMKNINIRIEMKKTRKKSSALNSQQKK